MLEFKSLLLGLVFALGTFSVKSGFGLSYLIIKKNGLFRKVALFTVVTSTYLLIFLASWQIANTIDLISHFNRLKSLFDSGMILHILMAAGTLFWAVSLLKDDESSSGKSYGWIALVTPCPICCAVIFFVTGFLVALFPSQSLAAVLASYAVYLVITLLTIVFFTLSRRLTKITPERALGLAMLFVSAYFFVATLVAPNFAELERIYRIAGYSSKELVGDTKGSWILGIITILSFATGFIAKRVRRG